VKEFEYVTTDAAVETYESAIGVFMALLHEVRLLSRKKPDATLSASKVKLINIVLGDLLTILKGEPQAKYLQILDNEELPQVSDALMMMVQFEAGMDAFRGRYFKRAQGGFSTAAHYWITEETLKAWDEEEVELEEDGDEDEQ
jgi:hypothetical protein